MSKTRVQNILEDITEDEINRQINICLDKGAPQYILDGSEFLGLKSPGYPRTVFLKSGGELLPLKMIARIAYAKCAPDRTHKANSYTYANVLEALNFHVVKTAKGNLTTRLELDAGTEQERQYHKVLRTKRYQKFRRNVIRARNGRCFLTYSGVVAALEAAHILPVKDNGSDKTSNGILLRRDIHRLFDMDLIRICERSGKVILDAEIAEEYGPQIRHEIALKEIDLDALIARNKSRG